MELGLNEALMHGWYESSVRFFLLFIFRSRDVMRRFVLKVKVSCWYLEVEYERN